LIQLQPLPKLQTQKTVPKLPHPIEANPIDQHPRHLRVVLRRLGIGREQLQLPPFALLVEDGDRFMPARLRRVVQFAQITHRALTRTVGRPHGFDQGPVGMFLAVFGPVIRAQKHSTRCCHGRTRRGKGVGLHYMGFREKGSLKRNGLSRRNRQK